MIGKFMSVCGFSSSKEVTPFQTQSHLCFPGLFDQLRVELLQVHQQQEHARDRRLPCLWDPSSGMQAAWDTLCVFIQKNTLGSNM